MLQRSNGYLSSCRGHFVNFINLIQISTGGGGGIFDFGRFHPQVAVDNSVFSYKQVVASSSFVFCCFVSQCALCIFNQDQKFDRLSRSLVFNTCKRVQNQSLGFINSNPQKTSFSILKLACRGHFLAMFTVVNFGSPMKDVFLD